MNTLALHWKVKASFVEYVARFGEIRLGAGARAGESGFVFPRVSSADESIRFSGHVEFTAHEGLLAVSIVDPWIQSDGNRSFVTIVDPAARASNDGRIRIAEIDGEVDDVPGSTYDAQLSAAGEMLFDFRYRAGEQLAPVLLQGS